MMSSFSNWCWFMYVLDRNKLNKCTKMSYRTFNLVNYWPYLVRRMLIVDPSFFNTITTWPNFTLIFSCFIYHRLSLHASFCQTSDTSDKKHIKGDICYQEKMKSLESTGFRSEYDRVKVKRIENSEIYWCGDLWLCFGFVILSPTYVYQAWK